MRKPDGSTLTSYSVGTDGHGQTIPSLPETGTYYIDLDPTGANTGSAEIGLGVADTPGTLNIGWYTYGNSSCEVGDEIDPVTAIFYPTYIDDSRVQSDVNYHTGWGDVWFGSPQFFWANGTCAEDVHESASAAFFQTRYHIRFKHCDEVGYPPIPCEASSNEYEITLGTPHHENIVSCGHAVDGTVNGWSGFDNARNKLYETMHNAHYTTELYVGNTKAAVQCNGEVANSNGYVRFIRVTSH